MTTQPGSSIYTQGFGSRPENVEVPHIDIRDPASTDINFPQGKRWINSVDNSEFTLTSFTSTNGIVSANWVISSSAKALYPITPYVVGPKGISGYQTIQSALDQANADIIDGTVSAAAIYIQPGTYTENLMCYAKISVIGTVGASGESITTIVGHHIPPASGNFSFINLILQSTDDVFTSSAAGTGTLICKGCIFNIAHFIFNLVNWMGSLEIDSCTDISSSNSIITNNTGAPFTARDSQLGASVTAGNMSGVSTFNSSTFGVALSQGGSGSSTFNNCIFNADFTCAGSSSNIFNFCSFVTGTNSALIQSSSGTLHINNCYIDSQAATTIDGSGIGAVTLTNVAFSGAAVFSGLLMLSWGYVYTGSITTQGPNSLGGITDVGGLRVIEDLGGAVNTVAFSNTANEMVSTGTGTIKMGTINNASSSAWIKIYIGTIAYFIPCFTTDSP